MPNFEDVLQEISDEQRRAAEAFDIVRRRHLGRLSEFTGRNTIAYYSGWQSKPGIGSTEIRDEDRDGFMRCLHGINYDNGLDLILHTPGGSIAATQSIISYLKEKFGRNIRAIVPHTAMSGGTIMACSAKTIIMARHSSIGPIDPQIRGIPATGVIQEFTRAYKEITQSPSTAHVWAPILGQYPPTFIGNCQNAIDWSEQFTREMLSQNMFKGKRNKQKLIDKVIKDLTDYETVKTHERQIGYEEARKIGLNVSLLEDDDELQDLVLTVHHCFAHTLSNTNAIKIIENNLGAAFVKIKGSS